MPEQFIKFPARSGGDARVCASLVLIVLALWLTGCRSDPDTQSRVHSMWMLTSAAQTRPLTSVQPPVVNGMVFLTESDPPSGHWAEHIAKVDAGTVNDQPTEAVLIMLADEARKAGANGVFCVKIWRQGSGFTWNAPHGSGLAVRLVDTNAVADLNGYWY